MNSAQQGVEVQSMPKKKKQVVQVGDVLAIPLHDGRFGFCRVLKDASIGVYHQYSISQTALPNLEEPYLFVVPVYRDLLTSGEWPRVCRSKFLNDEGAWPPPYFVRDLITGEMSIYHHGVMRPATAKECKGLESAEIWDKEDVIQRIWSQLNE